MEDDGDRREALEMPLPKPELGGRRGEDVAQGAASLPGD